ncbi:MAG: ABC transporter ATP-binding protein [Conexivisphaerales archaeon]
MSILEAVSVRKVFSGLVALDNVSLQLNKNEVLGLIGPNGAGKTTLFNIIAGFMKPTSGKIIFEGREITGKPANRVCRLGIARTFQIPRPFGDMTVLENLQVARQFSHHNRSGSNSIDTKVILELTGLSERAGLEAKKLTVSEKKRLEVARALATSPKVLLLDEIAAGLTPKEGEWAVNLMKQLSEQFSISVIWVEHIMRLLMKGVQRVVVLDHGVKIAEGKPEQVVNDERVQQAYLGVKVGG